MINVVMYGVLNRGWMAEKRGGNKPSFDIEKRIRGCPISSTMITELNPAIAPALTRGRSQRNDSPAALIPTAMGSGTESAV